MSISASISAARLVLSLPSPSSALAGARGSKRLRNSATSEREIVACAASVRSM
ncbi:MAG: hypothetical protein P8Y76_15975 [bacterium]